MTFTLDSRTDLPVTLDARPVAELAPGPELRIVGELRDYGEAFPLPVGYRAPRAPALSPVAAWAQVGRAVVEGFAVGVRPR
jgi:hypothetical protein